MTIPHATPHNRTSASLGLVADVLPVSSLDFAISPGAKPTEATRQAAAVTATALPMFLDNTPNAAQIEQDVQAVVLELVDITARHRACNSLIGRVAYDGTHVTVSIGDMDCSLPQPEEEPGLYLVHRVAAEVGQYAGDHGGRVTWAAVPCIH
ncbi:hypothetical protein AB0D65_29200 [Streptomyces griseoloalbus]|uniref:ATP-binding protein n=1 Tax=Streptomyces griseoloalbus TaxID=67303 RepID=A0ABV3ECU1_9ACTN